MLEVFATYSFFISQKGFQGHPVDKFYNKFFISPSSSSQKESVASLNIVWFYLYSRVLTDTDYCTLQIIVRNAVSYT